MMKVFKIIAICFFVLIFTFALYVYFAGVKLIVENRSGNEIHDVEIGYNYGKGSFTSESILDGEVLKQSLGKIGEGSNFDIRWHESSGAVHGAKFYVYFSGMFGYHTVRIKILANGEVDLYEGQREIKRKTLENSRTYQFIKPTHLRARLIKALFARDQTLTKSLKASYTHLLDFPSKM